MENAEARKIIKDFIDGEHFMPKEIKLDPEDANKWVRLKNEPQKFEPKIFDGEWAIPNLHPVEGNIRALRIVTSEDGVTRIIGRQKKYLFVYPWLIN